MIVVTDSGSTKADWIFADQNGYEELFRTRGLNPFFHPADIIESVLQAELAPQADLSQVDTVYYYGAGCSDDKRVDIMSQGLQRIFTHASIHVEHDLLAAARATCGTDIGIACILGTGSNSCLYDGQRILDNVPSMGFLVGDEGSGCHLGKYLVRAYFYREMPKEVEGLFRDEVASDKTVILDHIYGQKPNVYLASLAEFMTRHLDQPFIRELAMKSFREFIRRHVMKYDGHHHYPIHFVGSIAFHFRELLHEALREFGLQEGEVIRKPIQNLVSYHLSDHSNQPVKS